MISYCNIVFLFFVFSSLLFLPFVSPSLEKDSAQNFTESSLTFLFLNSSLENMNETLRPEWAFCS